MNHQEFEKVIVRGTIGLGNELLEKPRSCDAFFGISLNKTISNSHLRMYLRWILDHSRQCPVLVDDWEFRHNDIVFNKMDAVDAFERTRDKGIKLAARIAGAIAEVRYSHNVVDYADPWVDRMWVCQSSGVIFQDGLAENILAPLILTYEEDEQFRQEVDAQVERNIGKRIAFWKNGVSERECQIGRERLARFVLEETAMTLLYVKLGYTTEIYAGSPIQVVVDLYDPVNIKYPKLRQELNLQEKYGHISLGIERTKQAK